VIGIPTLDVLAANFSETAGLVCPLLDAQRDLVYTAVYRQQGRTLVKMTEHMLVTIDDICQKLRAEYLAAATQPVILAGDCLVKYRRKIEEFLGAQGVIAPPHLQYPRAGMVAKLALAQMTAADDQMTAAVNNFITLQPLYLKKAEAEIVWEQKHCEVDRGRQDGSLCCPDGIKGY